MRDAYPSIKDKSQVVLRPRIAAQRRATIPLDCLCVILWHSVSLLVKNAEIRLSRCAALFSRLAEPLRCFTCIFGNSLAEVIAPTERELRFSVALFRLFLEQLKPLR